MTVLSHNIPAFLIALAKKANPFTLPPIWPLVISSLAHNLVLRGRALLVQIRAVTVTRDEAGRMNCEKANKQYLSREGGSIVCLSAHSAHALSFSLASLRTLAGTDYPADFERSFNARRVLLKLLPCTFINCTSAFVRSPCHPRRFAKEDKGKGMECLKKNPEILMGGPRNADDGTSEAGDCLSV